MAEPALTGVPEFGKFEIIKSGKTSLHITGVSGAIVFTQVTHNLGYAPTALVYYIDESGVQYSQQLPFATGMSVDDTIFVGFNNWVYAQTTSTDLYINATIGAAGDYGTFEFKYYLFRERGR